MTVEEGVPRSVTLYRLTDLPSIIEGLGHPDRDDLVAFFESVITSCLPGVAQKKKDSSTKRTCKCVRRFLLQSLI